MKKIRSYIVKGKEVFVGLEDSKKSWKVCVRSGRVIINEASMPAKYESLRSYLKNRFPECRIRVMYEAGFRGFGLHDNLVKDGWECVVTPPHTVTQEKCIRQKNDRIDCRRLSKNLESGDYRTCYVPDRELRDDRQVARLSIQIQRDITRLCSRIRRAIEYHGLERYFPGGSWGQRLYREAEEKIRGLPLSESLRFAFAVYFRELREVRALKAELLKRMRELRRSERYHKAVELLRSAPGIGPLTAIRLVLEWGDVSRFDRKEEFASFLGLIPSEYSTGERDRKGHITKQGSRCARSWLIESSWVAIRHDPALLEKYKAVVSNTGSGKKAIVAVARKLAIRLRALLLSGVPYQVGLVEA